MTRYQVLRRLGCDTIAAAAIALLNWAFNVPLGQIKFLTVTIHYEGKEQP